MQSLAPGLYSPLAVPALAAAIARCLRSSLGVRPNQVGAKVPQKRSQRQRMTKKYEEIQTNTKRYEDRQRKKMKDKNDYVKQSETKRDKEKQRNKEREKERERWYTCISWS